MNEKYLHDLFQTMFICLRNPAPTLCSSCSLSNSSTCRQDLKKDFLDLVPVSVESQFLRESIAYCFNEKSNCDQCEYKTLQYNGNVQACRYALAQDLRDFYYYVFGGDLS